MPRFSSYAESLSSSLTSIYSLLAPAISSMRYYSYDADRQTLVRVFEITGDHAGRFFKIHESHQSNHSAFQFCIDHLAPICFKVVGEGVRSAITANSEFLPQGGPIPEVLLTDDPCPELAVDHGRAWVDIPLYVEASGTLHVCGKLSCNMTASTSISLVHLTLEQHYDRILAHAAVVDHCYLRAVMAPLSRLQRILAASQDLEELFANLIDEIERSFDHVEACIFSVIRGDKNSSLEARVAGSVRSFHALCCVEDSDPNALLSNLPSRAVLRNQSLSLHIDSGEVVISGKEPIERFIIDENASLPGELICIPISAETLNGPTDAKSFVLVVERTVEGNEDRSFAEIEVALLSRICNDLLPPVIQHLVETELNRIAQKWLSAYNSLSRQELQPQPPTPFQWGFASVLSSLGRYSDTTPLISTNGARSLFVCLNASESDFCRVYKITNTGAEAPYKTSISCLGALRKSEGFLAEVLSGKGGATWSFSSNSRLSKEESLFCPAIGVMAGARLARNGVAMGALMFAPDMLSAFLHPVSSCLQYIATQFSAVFASRKSIQDALSGLQYDCEAPFLGRKSSCIREAEQQARIQIGKCVMKTASIVAGNDFHIDYRECRVFRPIEALNMILSTVKQFEGMKMLDCSSESIFACKEIFVAVVYKILLSVVRVSLSLPEVSLQLVDGFVRTLFSFEIVEEDTQVLFSMMDTGADVESSYGQATTLGPFLGISFAKAAAMCHSFPGGASGSLQVLAPRKREQGGANSVQMSFMIPHN